MRMSPNAKKRSILGLLAVVLIVTGAVTAQESTEKPTRDRSRRRGFRARRSQHLKVGQDAPKFELPVLVEEKDKTGKKVARITSKRVKLSGFRGKQIVCIFFSSYT